MACIWGGRIRIEDRIRGSDHDVLCEARDRVKCWGGTRAQADHTYAGGFMHGACGIEGLGFEKAWEGRTG